MTRGSGGCRAGMGVWKKGYPVKPNPQNERTVPWKQLLPMQLKNHVSGKSDKIGETVCIQEISNMFTCLKEADFKNSLCAEQIKTFNDCYFNHLEKQAALKQQLAAGKLTPNTRDQKKLNHRQLNMLLARYPQFNYQEPKK